MKTPITYAIILSAGFALSSPEAAAQREQQPQTPPAPAQTTSQSRAAQAISGWGEAPRAVAQQMIARYGEPDEVTHFRVAWHNNGPWKRTEVRNETTPHNFPQSHADVLYQTIDYSVREDRVGEVNELNGSLLIDRVKGELTARCDSEETNFLIINVAHQMLEGRITAKVARHLIGEGYAGTHHQAWTEGFSFELASAPQGDPGLIEPVFGGRDD